MIRRVGAAAPAVVASPCGCAHLVDGAVKATLPQTFLDVAARQVDRLAAS